MASTVTQFRCLLISPGDLADERDALQRCAVRWNAQIGQALGTHVELVLWESHAVPEMGAEPQAIINKQLGDACDFAVALFWSRLGTPTEKHASGSVEEIERMIALGRRVLLYFNGAPVPQDKLDAKQYEALQAVKRDYMKRGLVDNFANVADLEQKVMLHLTRVVGELLNAERGGKDTGALNAPQPSPKPDVRVRVSPAISMLPPGLTKSLSVTVENHSPATVFTNFVLIRLKDGKDFIVPHSPLNGDAQRRRELRPGEAFSFHYTKDIFDEGHYGPDDLEYAFVVDDIHRTYESDRESFAAAVRELFKDEPSRQSPRPQKRGPKKAN